MHEPRESTLPQSSAPGREWLLLLFAFFLVWTVRATVLYSIDSAIASEVWRKIYADTVRLFIWVVPVLIYVKRIERARPLTYLKLSTPITRKALWQSMALIALYFISAWLLDHFVKGLPLAPTRQLSSRDFLSALFYVPVAPLAEEIFFRGFVLQKCAAEVRFWIANLITSFLFVAIHWPYWLYSGGFQSAKLMDSGAIFLLSLFLGYLVRKSDSLWPSITAHILNNFISGYLR